MEQPGKESGSLLGLIVKISHWYSQASIWQIVYAATTIPVDVLMDVVVDGVGVVFGGVVVVVGGGVVGVAVACGKLGAGPVYPGITVAV